MAQTSFPEGLPQPHVSTPLSPARSEKEAAAGSVNHELQARPVRISSPGLHHPLGELIKLSFQTYKPISSRGSEVKENCSRNSQTFTSCRETGTWARGTKAAGGGQVVGR